MLDRKIGASLPGKVVRMGKAWHGLVKLVSYDSPDGATIETSGGRTIPFPYSAGGLKKFKSAGGTIPHVSVYMHPSALHSAEMPNGMNWSQYAIMQLDRRDGFSNAGLSDRWITFFFTPDYDSSAPDFQPIESHALPIRIDSYQTKVIVYFYNPIHYDQPISSMGGKTTTIDAVGDYFHSSINGRTHYIFFNGFSFSANFKHTESSVTPSVRKVEISGRPINAPDPLDGITVTGVDVVGGPNDSHSNEYRNNVIYKAIAGNDPITYEERDYFPTGTGKPWFLIYRDYKDHKETSGVAMACIFNEVLSYLVAKRIDTDLVSSVGDVVYTQTGHSSTLTEIKSYRKYFELALGSVVSSVEILTSVTESSWSNYVNGDLPSDPPKVDENGGDASGSTTITLEGNVVYTLPSGAFLDIGNLYTSRFAGIPVPSLRGFGVYGLYSVELISDRDYKITEIYVSVQNFRSSDLSAISVYVRQGVTDVDGYDSWLVVPSTVTQKFCTGTVFSKGGSVLVDPLTLTPADVDPSTGLVMPFDRPLHRAYNPLTNDISAVHSAPLIYQ